MGNWNQDTSVDDADSMDSGIASFGADPNLGGSGGDFEGVNFAGQQDFQMDELDRISNVFTQMDKVLGNNSKYNFNQNQTMAVLNAQDEIRGYDSRGGRYGADDAAFFAGAIGAKDLQSQMMAGVDNDMSFLERGFSNVTNAIAERFGTSLQREYAILPAEQYIGKITEDYSGTDAIGNVLGLFTPGGGKVDRYRSEELTKTGTGTMQFGEGKAFYGAIDTRYAMTPEQEQAMFAAKRAEAEAERARNSTDPVAQVASTVTGTVTRPRSAILGGLLGDVTNPAYNIGAPYVGDALDAVNPFSYFGGGDTGGIFGFAEGGTVQKAQMGGVQQSMDGPVGFVGGPPEQMTEAETVADDVPVEVPEGSYVLNAAAVEFMGSADVKKMILDAMAELKSQGVDTVQNIDKIELDTQVSLLVSKGEVLIPPAVAQVIGYDRLEKINRRGLKETEKRVQENGQSPEAEALDQQPANPAEGMTMARGGLPSTREELDRQISEDPASFYETVVAGDMGKVLAETREVRDGVNGMFNVHRLYEKMLRDIEEYKAPEVMSRTNVEMGQTQSQRDTTLMESDGRLPLIEDDMTPQNAANMYQNFPSFRRYIMDRIEAGQSEQVQGVLDNYEKFLEGHAGDNLPEQNPVYTEEDFAKARELEQMEFVRDFIDSRVVSKTPVGGFLSKSY